MEWDGHACLVYPGGDIDSLVNYVDVSYGSPGTNDRLYDWKVIENGSIYFDDYHSYIYNFYGSLSGHSLGW